MTALARPLALRDRAHGQGSGPYQTGGGFSSTHLVDPARETRAAASRRASSLGRGAVLFAVLLAVAACASITPGSDPVVVRAQDVLINSLDLYEQVMTLHMAHSQDESPSLYSAMEQVRTKFPKAHRALSDALTAYRSRKDPEALHAAVSAFFGEVETLAPDGSPFAVGVRLLRRVWDGGAA